MRWILQIGPIWRLLTMCSVKIYVGWCDEDKLRPSKLSSWSSKEHSCWLKLLIVGNWEQWGTHVLHIRGRPCSCMQRELLQQRIYRIYTDDKAVAHSAYAKEKCGPIYLVHNGTHVFLASRWSMFFFFPQFHIPFENYQRKMQEDFFFCFVCALFLQWCKIPTLLV